VSVTPQEQLPQGAVYQTTTKEGNIILCKHISLKGMLVKLFVCLSRGLMKENIAKIQFLPNSFLILM